MLWGEGQGSPTTVGLGLRVDEHVSTECEARSAEEQVVLLERAAEGQAVAKATEEQRAETCVEQALLHRKRHLKLATAARHKPNGAGSRGGRALSMTLAVLGERTSPASRSTKPAFFAAPPTALLSRTSVLRSRRPVLCPSDPEKHAAMQHCSMESGMRSAAKTGAWPG